MTAAEMRADAARKRHAASVARRLWPFPTAAADQATMRNLATALEAEAAELEAAADTMDAMDRSSSEAARRLRGR